MLKKATIEWAGTATVHDILDIDVAVARWGNTSFDVGFAGRVGDRPVFTCTITYVGVKVGTKDTMPPPAAVRALMDANAPA
jgi:acyl-CoA thioesterase FadM